MWRYSNVFFIFCILLNIIVHANNVSMCVFVMQGRDGLPGRDGPRGPEGRPGPPGQAPFDPSGRVKGEKGERVSTARAIPILYKVAQSGLK